VIVTKAEQDPVEVVLHLHAQNHIHINLDLYPIRDVLEICVTMEDGHLGPNVTTLPSEVAPRKDLGLVQVNALDREESVQVLGTTQTTIIFPSFLNMVLSIRIAQTILNTMGTKSTISTISIQELLMSMLHVPQNIVQLNGAHGQVGHHVGYLIVTV